MMFRTLVMRLEPDLFFHNVSPQTNTFDRWCCREAESLRVYEMLAQDVGH